MTHEHALLLTGFACACLGFFAGAYAGWRFALAYVQMMMDEHGLPKAGQNRK